MKLRTKKQLKSFISLLLVLLLLLTGCSAKKPGPVIRVAATELTAGFRPGKVQERNVDGDFKTAQYQYALSLLQTAAKIQGEETFMLSPLSLELALAMAANAAEGETLAQLLTLLGASDLQELNEVLHTYVSKLGEECSAANSLWLRKGTADPDKAFLQAIVDHYDAEIYEAAFDGTTVTDVNEWVKAKTNGMIDGILEKISPNDLAYLLNAVCIEAKWESPYEDGVVRSGTFYSQSGAEQRADLMFSVEYGYFSDDHAQGFVKDYEDGRFQFAAIRPNDGVDVFDYLAELDAYEMRMMVLTAKNERVLAKIPKFTTESDIDMEKILRSMGVEALFTRDELTGVGSSVTVTGVRQKTFIEVNEEGTRAAAVTGLTEAAGTQQTEQIHTVYLDRPFIYLILDGNSGLPVFMGVVTEITQG